MLPETVTSSAVYLAAGDRDRTQKVNCDFDDGVPFCSENLKGGFKRRKRKSSVTLFPGGGQQGNSLGRSFPYISADKENSLGAHSNNTSAEKDISLGAHPTITSEFTPFHSGTQEPRATLSPLDKPCRNPKIGLNAAKDNSLGAHSNNTSDVKQSCPKAVPVVRPPKKIQKKRHCAASTMNVLERSPLVDCTNLRRTKVTKLSKTIDREEMENVKSNLFQDTVTDVVDYDVDYENIDHSRIHGFDESDADTMSIGADTEFGSETEMMSEKMTVALDLEDLDEHRLWCEKMISEVPAEYKTLGKPNIKCKKCGAQMWKEERTNKDVKHGTPEFNLCCFGGRVILPGIKPTPPFLKNLYEDKQRGPTFKRCVRQYNSMFSFTSMGGKVDDSINKGGAPYIYRLNGQNHHKIGSLLPQPGEPPKFAQLYIYDTENEVDNRMRWINLKDTNTVDPAVVEGLLQMLDETNHLVKCFRMARDRFKEEEIVELKIVLRQSRSESGRVNHIGDSNEVAGIMVGDMDDTCGGRDIVLESKIDGLQRISDIHPLLMALQYPLMFPYGEDGFHEKMYIIKQPGDERRKRLLISQRRFYASRIMVKLSEGQTMRMAGRLWQQYCVDAFSAIEQSRLWYVRSNQTQLRNELYSHICDYMKEGDGDMSNIGKSYILPSSFVGSRRYMQQNYQDSLAVCRFIGHPDLFLTMTCNPMWDEVLQMMTMLPACKPSDCPDIIARVFKLKLQQLTDDIKKKDFFGKCIAVMYVVEWQKRGLPHVHMLIWLDAKSKKNLNKNVDKFVSAEIPNKEEDPSGYAAVKLFMIHGPCGNERMKSPCMRNKKCIRHFPKRYCEQTMFDNSGFPIYMRRRTPNIVRKGKSELDNAWVVPYNRELLIRYQCHINIEICNRARCLKYLFKYCLKGSDRATVEIKSKQTVNGPDGKRSCVDEINRFFDGRYVCAAEACHRIFAFDIHHRSVGVERLPFHLEGKKSITYHQNQQVKKVVEKGKYTNSKLEAFFKLCQHDDNARRYTYDEIPGQYVWDKKLTEWMPRKQGFQIGRLSYTHHSTGEVWYLRMLLSKVRGPTSFKDLRKVNGKLFDTYQEACKVLGLLDDDREWDACLEQCKQSGLPPQIRHLFVQIICNNRVGDLKQLWINHWQSMADDILHTQRKLTGNANLVLMEQDLQYMALSEIHKILRGIGRSIKDFKQLPQPPERFLNNSLQNLVMEEHNYDLNEMRDISEKMISKLNNEQRNIFEEIVGTVRLGKGGVFFVYGSGGCGKTYLWKTIITKLRSEAKIVLPVASSGIAATLLPGGRTAHSRFKIPIVLDDLSTCSIAHKSDIAELLKKTDLIIWDEAPMQHRYAFEALDRTLRDIMKAVDPFCANRIFGGIPVLMGGDFRQILPVINKGSRSDIVASCITRSRIWDSVKLFHLKTNMRLNTGSTTLEKQEILIFGNWVLRIGDGKTFNENSQYKNKEFEGAIDIPLQYCLSGASKAINTLIGKTFPELGERYEDVLYLSQRAILCPTNETVYHINDVISDLIPGEYHTYLSADKAEQLGSHDDSIDRDFPVEYLNSLRLSGLPAHELNLKPGMLVMLMRNLNQTLGLCNGTRLIIRRCLLNAIQCEVVSGAQTGSIHYIPKMELSPSDAHLGCHLIRRQFPLQVCYAMTINKAQGQSLEVVGLYLPKAVFSHGQLYVALSRVTSPKGLNILIDSDTGYSTNITTNVVYEEIFYNLKPLVSENCGYI